MVQEMFYDFMVDFIIVFVDHFIVVGDNKNTSFIYDLAYKDAGYQA